MTIILIITVFEIEKFDKITEISITNYTQEYNFNLQHPFQRFQIVL